MKGEELIATIRRKIEDEKGSDVTDSQIADRLGLTLQGLRNWRDRPAITTRQMTGLLFRMEAKGIKRAEQKAIRPIVEFFELDPSKSKGGARSEIFSVKDDKGNDHPYLKGLRKDLEDHHGVCIFYDSRGRALYAGKARSLSLWAEINNAYNRDREVQQIRRVKHPARRQPFRTSDEKRRQIKLHTVPLHDLGAYFSAYCVSDGLIGELESLLIRGFANDLLNVRMENFYWDNNVKKRKKIKLRRKVKK